MKHLILAISVIALTAACSSKQEVKDAGVTAGADQEAQSAEKAAAADGAELGENAENSSDMFGASSTDGLLVVHFEFDQATLTSSAEETLRQNAEYLREHPKAKIVIEGHTDERGANEYNLALGDRRAKSVRKYLGLLGIDSSRMQTVSYGAEQPLDMQSGESAWSKNRRAEFRELD